MDINDFYTRVAKSYDIVVKDDSLWLETNGKLSPFTASGVPMVLPTPENVRTLLTTADDGSIVTSKHLFNPLDETVIRGDSITLTKLKALTGVRLGNMVASVGTLLLLVGANKEHQAKTGMLVNQFLVRLSEARNPGVKDIIDDKTLDSWIKIYNSAFEPKQLNMCKAYSKKGGKLGTTKYNRVATIKFPIYEALLKLSKGGKVNGVTLRNKDITVFKIIFEYLVEGISPKGIVTIGSNDTMCPGFISIMSLYLNIATKAQQVLAGVSGVDAEWEDSAKVELLVEKSELSELSGYERALAKLPRDNDIARGKLTGTEQVATEAEPTSAPQQKVVADTPNNTASAIRKALYGGVSGVSTPIIQQGPAPAPQPAYPAAPQQPVYPQQQQPVYPGPQQQPGYPQQQQPVYPGPQQPVYPGPQQRPAYPQQQQPVYPQQQQPVYPQGQPQRPAYPQQPVYPQGQPMPARSIGELGTVSEGSFTKAQVPTSPWNR